VSRYLVIVEPTPTGFSAYSPDVLGCVATAATREAVEREMREALAFHLDGLREDGRPLPRPIAAAAYVDAAA
jgi:predicted RNase H-like HicB family nuclease